MLTKLYPMVQFQKDTWEIDEFDCASLFLLIGAEKAMLIDCGMGIGDLKGAVRMLTDKPLIVVISHGHIDHTGNARQFDEIWIHPKDQAAPVPQSLERRRYDTERIARRQKNCIGGAYSMFHLYPYDLDVDLREPQEPVPVIHDLYDGQQFDLGGGRIVTAYECPGHSPGEMIFLDEKTRSLFCGDALNFNLGVSAEPVEKTLRYLKRMRDLGDRYDGIYNGHHDFRALGMPWTRIVCPRPLLSWRTSWRDTSRPARSPASGAPTCLSPEAPDCPTSSWRLRLTRAIIRPPIESPCAAAAASSA